MINTRIFPRRRVLCVRPYPNPAASALPREASDEWVATLALHCDVTVIEQDFDFAEACERLKPDFVIFDSVHWVRSPALNITNPRAFPEIPRALYYDCDPHEPMRPYLMPLLEACGVDTIFCGIEHLQQMPELALRDHFVIPKFIDSDIFRDYGLEKTIPVSVFGGHLFPTFYAWRAKFLEEIQRLIPTLVYPHPGYTLKEPNPFEARNEKYARLLSASYFSVSDTTRLDYVVRKHLEIPAAGAVLVAPRSEVVEALGFVDMENCLLGEGDELYRRIRSVAADTALYEHIRKAGHDLVHGRYTRKHWTYMLDWFECRMTCGPDEVTQQNGRFGKFRNVPAQTATASVAGLSYGPSPMSAALRNAASAILSGRALIEAKAGLQEAVRWIGHIAEPHFLLGVIAMLEGNMDTAVEGIGRRPISFGKGEVAAGQFELGLLDPCELAMLLCIGAIQDDVAFCSSLLSYVPTTPHVAVRRAVWLLSGAPLNADFNEGLMMAQPGDIMSIHWIGQESLPQWLLLMARVLDATGQTSQASHLRTIAAAFDPSDENAPLEQDHDRCHVA
ncbi:glycosyltransferase [Sphingobium sp. DEHP117]|uniref:glycosyltransferase n=1 Tax=Sphingobium sp. DEHP117 TaxID=2993436 RepID=UPI0027D6287A|nr:glycosyltransferase [Sphingobium sp. DEHP117]MDQ4421388.1 glycosyltransferase [Sphingobium sp. DEHP117]